MVLLATRAATNYFCRPPGTSTQPGTCRISRRASEKDRVLRCSRPSRWKRSRPVGRKGKEGKDEDGWSPTAPGPAPFHRPTRSNGLAPRRTKAALRAAGCELRATSYGWLVADGRWPGADPRPSPDVLGATPPASGFQCDSSSPAPLDRDSTVVLQTY